MPRNFHQAMVSPVAFHLRIFNWTCWGLNPRAPLPLSFSSKSRVHIPRSVSGFCRHPNLFGGAETEVGRIYARGRWPPSWDIQRLTDHESEDFSFPVGGLCLCNRERQPQIRGIRREGEGIGSVSPWQRAFWHLPTMGRWMVVLRSWCVW